MKKSHCGLNESMNFNPVGRLAKHGVRNIAFQSLQWITGCASWKHWTNNRIQIWFLQRCQRKRKFQRMRLWTSARLQSAFLSQTLFGSKWCRNAHRNFFMFSYRDWKTMLDLAGGTIVYLACGATDLRKSYHGLAAIIKLKFKLDPYSRCMFAFCNRKRTSIKILQWDGSGFWILMKRLDRDSFHWPDTPDELQKVTLKEMHWLCDGLSLTPKGAFEERHPKIVV